MNLYYLKLEDEKFRRLVKSDMDESKITMILNSNIKFIKIADTIINKSKIEYVLKDGFGANEKDASVIEFLEYKPTVITNDNENMGNDEISELEKKWCESIERIKFSVRDYRG